MAAQRPMSGGDPTAGPDDGPTGASPASMPSPSAPAKRGPTTVPAVRKPRKPATRSRSATAVAGHRGRARLPAASSLPAGPADESRSIQRRPSRRQLIVDASIRVFARRGFAAASIQDIADEAGMLKKALYYHFAGKEELFEAALSRAIAANTAVIAAARPDDAPADPETFKKVVEASWRWVEANPDMARLLFLHMPGAATPGARALAREYQERSVRRAYDYFAIDPVLSNRRRGAAEHAVRTLMVRTVIGLALAVHPLQMERGPQTPGAVALMRDATAELCARIFMAREPGAVREPRRPQG